MSDSPLWPSPEPIWQAAPEAVAAGVSGTSSDAPALSGPWRLLLLGDGSPTRHLQSLTGLPVEVEVIAMAADPDPGAEAPLEVEELERPLLRRQVWLRCGSETLAWAESWWNHAEAEAHLRDRHQPIWRSLTAGRAELYREVDGLGQVQARWLEERFGCHGPFWSRHYRFFRQGRELTVIREVFSPALEEWLGPASPVKFREFGNES
ncbi:MAG: chorismate lyase [Cyanobacteriota bacterium]